jgi:hypothetical protein
MPCISENLAAKSTLIKDADQINTGMIQQTCDDPEGLPKGHMCTLTPSNHPCLTGAVALTCPGDTSVMLTSQKIQTHCQICHGVQHEDGDTDDRENFIEVALNWGPNVFGGIIDEVTPGIFGYAVYALSDCGNRQGSALATVPAIGIVPGMETCCNTKIYGTTILTQLAAGATSVTLGVYPLTSIGALDVGWTTSPIVDALPTSTTTAAAAAVPAKAVVDYRSGELPSEELNQSSVSLANVEAAGGKVEGEEDSSPQLGTKDDDDLPLFFLLVPVLVGIPAFCMCAYVAWKKQTRLKEEAVLDMADNGESQQPELVKPPHLQPSASHAAAPPEPKSASLPPIPPEPACDDSDSTSSPTRTTAATQAYKTKVDTNSA